MSCKEVTCAKQPVVKGSGASVLTASKPGDHDRLRASRAAESGTGAIPSELQPMNGTDPRR
jgi:hypothetical protein